jgi:hypothetical protein
LKKIHPKKKWRHKRLLDEIYRRKSISKKARRTSKDRIRNFRSDILKYFANNGFVNEVSKSKSENHKYTIKVPEIFSLIDNPDNSLEVLEDLSNAIRDKYIKELEIDHSKCEQLDLDCSTIMDIFITQAKLEWKRRKHGCSLKGIINNKVREIIDVTGLLYHLKHSSIKSIPQSTKDKYKIFELCYGKKNINLKAYESSNAERTTTNLTIYFKDLLEEKGYIFDDDGLGYLSMLISEVIDNAENHSEEERWYVTGYLKEEDENTDVCNICIFDFGDTISSTLSNADLNEKLITNINKLIKKHRRKGFLDFKFKWTIDNLWTLYALQEGISRYNIKRDKTDRGHGTVNLIEFFMNLSCDRKSSKMVILSGNTYILFDGNYKLQKKVIGNETRQVIAFNSENDLSNKPDERYVKNLKNRFPGTIISMKFYLDKKFLINKE